MRLCSVTNWSSYRVVRLLCLSVCGSCIKTCVPHKKKEREVRVMTYIFLYYNITILVERWETARVWQMIHMVALKAQCVIFNMLWNHIVTFPWITSQPRSRCHISSSHWRTSDCSSWFTHGALQLEGFMKYILPNKYPPSTKTLRNSEVITAAQHKVSC